jgi:hypothetical protein
MLFDLVERTGLVTKKITQKSDVNKTKPPHERTGLERTLPVTKKTVFTIKVEKNRMTHSFKLPGNFCIRPESTLWYQRSL